MKSYFEKLPSEKPYDFRSKLEELHVPNRRNHKRSILPGEFEITGEWQIRIPENSSDFIKNASEDLKDYLKTSMGVDLKICFGVHGKHSIVLESGNKTLNVKRSFLFRADSEQITISGFDERGCAMGVYYLEDLLNLREGPFLETIAPLEKKPLFSPRIIHSGYGKTLFTLSYMKKIAHYGFDAIALYTNRESDLNFHALFRDAETAGLDIYFYSKFPNPIYPTDPEAKAYYRSTYGELFRRYPSARGILFVGESIRFPSRDPHVQTHDKEDFTLPNSSMWPCSDYPELMRVIKEAVTEVAPGADIVFWTYNWGWAPEKKRIKLIEELPEGITLNVNFALHDTIQVGETLECALDYTLGCAGPSRVFTGEGFAAAKRGMKLYAMTNSAGKTWDFGCAPYIPAYFQWLKRYRNILEARETCGLSGLLESHSYGWQPSIASELAKWLFWSNPPETEKLVRMIAVCNSSERTAETLMESWKKWSDGMDGYPAPIEDQYGPCRVGPSYPFFFSPDMLHTYYTKFKAYPDIDQQIVFPCFRPVEYPGGGEPAAWRVPAEINYLAVRIKQWDEGIRLLKKTVDEVDKNKKLYLLKELALGCFIRNTLITTRNIKKWWLLNSKLLIETDVSLAKKLLAEMSEILNDELENVEATIPLVRFDSRLGFECAMGYAGDERHLEWKKKILGQLTKKDIPDYYKLLDAKERLKQ